MRDIAIYFLLSLVLPLLQASTITFNPQYIPICDISLGGCSFFNNSIWSTNTVPSVDDIAVISGVNTSSLMLFSNEPIVVSQIQLNYATLRVDNSPITAGILMDSSSELHVTNSTATLISPSSASLIYMTDSVVNMTGVDNQAVVEGMILFSGSNSLFAQNVSLFNLTFSTGTTCNIVASGLVLGNATIPGNITITGYGITINGSVSTTGVVTLDKSILNLNNGSFAPLMETIVVHNQSSISLAGSLTANVQLTAGGLLTVPPSSNGTIYGNFTNGGLLSLNYLEPLQVVGNYVQHNGSFELMAGYHNVPPLTVTNGTITISNDTNTLSYWVSAKPFLKSYEFNVAGTNFNITGTFTNDAAPLAGSDLQRSLPIRYSSNNIYLTYKMRASDIDGWVWGIIAIIILVCLIMPVVWILICLKNRRKYQKL